MGGKSSGSEQRALTAEELSLISTQDASLEQAIRIAQEQYNLSTEDREYIAGIYRGDLDPSDPKVQAEVTKRLKDTPAPTREQFEKKILKPQAEYQNRYDEYGDPLPVPDNEYETQFDQEGYDKALAKWEGDKDSLIRKVSGDLGTKGIDEYLFEGILESKGEASVELAKWKGQAEKLGSEYTSKLTGISDKFKNTLQTASDKMGTADADIYSQTKGAGLAGISQAYAEARKQAEGGMARRGIAGSGVAEQGISGLYAQEAQQKSQAYGSAYQQAIGLSDQRRQQQMGIAGQIAQSGTGTAGSIYQTNLGTATSSMQNTLANQQQGLANLQMGSGVSQGIFGQSQNYLAQAGGTANQSASVAGNTAVGIGNMQSQYAQAQQAAAAQESAGVMGAVGTIAGMAGAAHIAKK